MLLSGDICQAIAIPTASSISAFIWQAVLFLWPWNWIWISLIIIGWIFWEIATRNGNSHYNSKNGFSPSFNIFVGSGLYWGIQAILLLIFEKVFGRLAYCIPLPYAVHASILVLSALFLHWIGFWPELRFFKNRRRNYSKKRNRKKHKRRKKRY